MYTNVQCFATQYFELFSTFSICSSDVASEMEYDERLARFRQGLVNPFDRGEDETSAETKGPSKTGESLRSITKMEMEKDNTSGCVRQQQ